MSWPCHCIELQAAHSHCHGFHCAIRTQSVHSCCPCWASGSLPVFSYCTQSGDEHFSMQLCGHMYTFLLDTYLRVKLLDREFAYVQLSKYFQFFKVTTPIYPPISSSCLTNWPTQYFLSVFPLPFWWAYASFKRVVNT